MQIQPFAGNTNTFTMSDTFTIESWILTSASGIIFAKTNGTSKFLHFKVLPGFNLALENFSGTLF